MASRISGVSTTLPAQNSTEWTTASMPSIRPAVEPLEADAHHPHAEVAWFGPPSVFQT